MAFSVDHHMQHRFWLAEAVLYGRAARVQHAGGGSGNEEGRAHRNLRHASLDRNHFSSRIYALIIKAQCI